MTTSTIELRASTCSEPGAADTAPPARQESYGQILTSSALIGGSSLLNIAIGLVRTKVFATLLGPAGFGLFGLYNSVADMAQNLAGMGVNSSGVRQIAEAVGTQDTARIARTAAVLRRTSWVLGTLGALLLVVFARQVSMLTFRTDTRTTAIAVLSIAILFRLVAGGQAALIQGMRRISDLARMGVWGALSGTVAGIVLIYLLHQRGIVPSLIATAGMTIATAWWYSRKISIDNASLTFGEIRQEAGALLRLGLAFMASGFLTIGVAYWVRITILHRVGFEAAGLYQSAWSLGSLYVGLILQAMGADFYPRLTAAAADNSECNRLVNEQSVVGMLLAGPGVLATLTFAPAAITVFYSGRFQAAVGVLRWICLGTALQVTTWPLGFITMAKGKQFFFFFSELSWAFVAATLTWFLVRNLGLTGAGIGFFASYVFHLVITYPVARHLSRFHWSPASTRTGLIFAGLIGAVFCLFQFVPFALAMIIGTSITITACAYSARKLLRLMPLESLPGPFRRLALASRSHSSI
jgi:O-antigen/teichoic acid export membrane protein